MTDVSSAPPDSIGGYAVIPLTKSQLDLLNNKVMTLDDLIAGKDGVASVTRKDNSKTNEEIPTRQPQQPQQQPPDVHLETTPTAAPVVNPTADSLISNFPNTDPSKLDDFVDFTFDQSEILELERLLGTPLMSSDLDPLNNVAPMTPASSLPGTSSVGTFILSKLKN